MNLTANRQELAKAVKTAYKAASRLKDAAVMCGVLLEVNEDKGLLNLTGTDGTVRIMCRVKCDHISEGGKAVLTPIAADMLRLLPGETVEIGQGLEQNTLTLKGGQCEYALPVLPAADFPKVLMDFPSDFIHGKGLNSLIRHAGFAAASDNPEMAKRGLQCIKITFGNGGMKAEATNGSVAALATTPHGADGSLQLTLPERVLRTLTEVVDPNDDLYIGVKDQAVFFMTESMIFSALLYTGQTVEIGKVLEQIKPESVATADAKELYGLAANMDSILTEKDDPCVILAVEDGKITAKTKTATGAASAFVPATNTVPTGKEFYYNLKWLLTCFRLAAGPTALLFDPVGRLIIVANENRMCIMPRGPIKIKAAEPKKEKKAKKAA